MPGKFPAVLFAICVYTVNFSFGQEITSLAVSPEHPIRHSDTTLRKGILQWSATNLIPNKLYEAHPSSVNFPGIVRPGFASINAVFHLAHLKADADEYKISKKFIFSNAEKATLYSTGLYAVPGQPVYVSRPAAFSGRQVYLLIGAHSDYLGPFGANDDDWRRMPGVVSGFLMDSTFQFGSSPFGGLIYLAVSPEEQSINAEVTFKNVIAAPYYKQGTTTAADWKKQLASNKAPWGEIASDKVIITLPDSALQKIENPDEVLMVWNKILSAEYELSQLPSPFIRPLRMVLDEQISIGAMHSGYPIMIEHSRTTNMLPLDIITSPKKLLLPSAGGANWGFFHEIGHGLQNWEWVFNGTAEVGCNFYSLYVFDELLKTRKGAHINIRSDIQQKIMQAYFDRGASYEAYQQDPFLGLIPFMQLQKQFGWQPFKDVFKWYLENLSYDFDMSDVVYEKVNTFKINRFVERFSIIIHRNLVPFFRAWGIPVSESVAQRLKKFKPWIPGELKHLIKNSISAGFR